MKKSTKSSIIAGVVIAVVGVIVLICALGMSGWKLNSGKNWETDTVTVEKPITKLELKVNYGKVTLKQSAVETASVTYQYDEKHRPEIAVNDNGLLKIHTAEKKWHEIGYWFGDAPTIEVTLPAESDFVIVDLELNAGTIEIGDGDWGVTVYVEVNAGAVVFGDVSMNDLHVDVNAGALDAGKIQCQKVACSVSAGAVSVKELTCGAFGCDVSAGAVEVKKLDSSRVKLDVSAGSVTLGLVGAQSDYRVSVDKSAGSCNVSSQMGTSATRALTVSISAGSVDVTFGK